MYSCLSKGVNYMSLYVSLMPIIYFFSRIINIIIITNIIEVITIKMI